ncbi:hypothetical protein G7Y89_g15546 [Cudoniella acicularis]|uniref:Methyltransferase type 11 domain-containing protein n=1 Tax=Cudoniella acicularis TaxID=354080 RepID=A0A8H4QL39_9HELO|nr:hypothetical protein G7Y89_g15546 [Cudoniella acicularis]
MAGPSVPPEVGPENTTVTVIMFDISWMDPDRETVAQRRTRKQNQARGPSRQDSSRSSKSLDSPQPRFQPGLLSLLGGSSKKTGSAQAPRPMLGSSHSDHFDGSAREILPYPADSESTLYDQPLSASLAVSTHNFSHTAKCNADLNEISPTNTSRRGDWTWTGYSTPTESSRTSIVDSPTSKRFLVQPLSPRSFVSRTTEVRVSPRESVEAGIDPFASSVHISAGNYCLATDEDIPTEQLSRFDIPPSDPEVQSVPSSERNNDLQPSFSPVYVPIRTRKNSWRPPDTWDCSEERSTRLSTTNLGSPTFRTLTTESQITPELTHVQLSIRRMEAANSKIILEHLKEEWADGIDENLYRELELEKHRWMLFALRDLKLKMMSTREVASLQNISSSNYPKLLSLYESHVVASFLAATTPPDTVLHHLSTTPLSPRSYPNVHPLAVTNHTTFISYSPNYFASIHAFSLPALLPASSLPQILKKCHGTLIKGGTLHLTILDPSPIPSTLGPRLRTWLNNNILLDLEKQFRCLNPSRVFPAWLQDVGLYGAGSTVLNVQFLASVNTKDTKLLLPKRNPGIKLGARLSRKRPRN